MRYQFIGAAVAHRGLMTGWNLGQMLTAFGLREEGNGFEFIAAEVDPDRKACGSDQNQQCEK
jgi:hypothetical protein